MVNGMKNVLQISNIEKSYKKFKALNGVNLSVEQGAIYGLIGKNGSGKTTLIRIVCGLQEPNSGSYQIYQTLHNDEKIADVRKKMGAIIETPSIYQSLNARDNLIEQYKIIGKASFDDIDKLLELVGLEKAGKKKAKNFSLGMKQRLGIAIALASDPDFLILDEPINGLDPQGIIEVRELILKLNKEKGITILISSHYLDELSKIATNYGFLDEGKIVKEISSVDLNKLIKKKIEIETKDIEGCVKCFEEENIAYEIIAAEKINIFGEVKVADIVLKLYNRNCVIDNIHEQEESLENYYMNLVGGKKND